MAKTGWAGLYKTLGSRINQCGSQTNGSWGWNFIELLRNKLKLRCTWGWAEVPSMAHIFLIEVGGRTWALYVPIIIYMYASWSVSGDRTLGQIHVHRMIKFPSLNEDNRMDRIEERLLGEKLRVLFDVLHTVWTVKYIEDIPPPSDLTVRHALELDPQLFPLGTKGVQCARTFFFVRPQKAYSQILGLIPQSQIRQILRCPSPPGVFKVNLIHDLTPLKGTVAWDGFLA